MKSSIYNISPIDGRYTKLTEDLKKYFSEAALIKYRVFIEVEYFLQLSNIKIEQLRGISKINAIK